MLNIYKYAKISSPGNSVTIFAWIFDSQHAELNNNDNENKFHLITAKHSAGHFGLLKLPKYSPVTNINVSSNALVPAFEYTLWYVQ